MDELQALYAIGYQHQPGAYSHGPVKGFDGLLELLDSMPEEPSHQAVIVKLGDQPIVLYKWNDRRLQWVKSNQE